jgi:hypothetical protein
VVPAVVVVVLSAESLEQANIETLDTRRAAVNARVRIFFMKISPLKFLLKLGIFSEL